MALVAAFFLRVLHYIYYLFTLCRSFWSHSDWSSPSPQTHRRRTPKHLAILLVSNPATEHQSTLVQTVVNSVEWCRAAGIQFLTVYEEHGTLLKCSQNIRDAFSGGSEESWSDSEIEYPLTPPPSDYSDSRPISPQLNLQLDSHTVPIRITDTKNERPSSKNGLHKRKEQVNPTCRNPLTLYLTSRESSKPAIAAVAQALAMRLRRKIPQNPANVGFDSFTLSIEELDNYLEFDKTLTSPDFMIVHSVSPSQNLPTPLELHGYPPWHIRLTEMYHSTLQVSTTSRVHSSTPKPLPLSEQSFTHALDEFAAAEMRFGK